MKILVTGATGFIGGNLVNSLIAKDHEVVCLARKTSKIEGLKEKGVPVFIGDMTDAGEIDRILKEIHPEVVYHCAAVVNGKDQDELFAFNADSTQNLCRACYSHDVKRLIYLSSIAVISGNSEVPLTEDLPYKASGAYGRSKIEAERIVIDYRQKGLKAVIIRPCIVFGEEEPHGFDKILQKIKMRCIPVLDIPEMDAKLNLVYIENLIEVLGNVLKNDAATEGTFLIADKKVMTIRKLLEITYDEFGAGPPMIIPGWASRVIINMPFLKSKIEKTFKDRVYDITQAVDRLGYSPKVSTEAGLRRSVKYWKEKHV